jgi:hypothetical protein
MPKQLIFFEINELNIDYISYYIELGYLPNWNRLITDYGYDVTYSENSSEMIEPWIMWPTIRSGMKQNEHNIFHLGEIGSLKSKQHWDIIEEKGFSVAAVSPINAPNTTTNSKFWIPDPWIDTKISGNLLTRLLSKSISQIVIDNAKGYISVKSLLVLLVSLLFISTFKSILFYIKQFLYITFLKQKWRKSIIFDNLIHDLYLYLFNKYKPDFSTIFLNAGAHIQHHYFFNSKVYRGSNVNPSWYIEKKHDPLLEILQLYDSLIAQYFSNKNIRFVLATGLSQIPCEETPFYWRLKNHSEFLKLLGINFLVVEPLMSRDFNIKFNCESSALDCAEILKSIVDSEGVGVFGLIDLRGCDLFVSLIYDKYINNNFTLFVRSNNKNILNFEKNVSFVARKNGRHISDGCLFDTQEKKDSINRIEISDIFKIILKHFGA